MGSSAADLIPDDASLSRLRDLATGCTACDLHRIGTQTVFGEGTAHAAVMLVGEQPGDKEDLAGGHGRPARHRHRASLLDPSGSGREP